MPLWGRVTPVDRLSGGEDSDDYAVIAPVREVLATSLRETVAEIDMVIEHLRRQHYFRLSNYGPQVAFQQASMRWYVLKPKRSL